MKALFRTPSRALVALFAAGFLCACQGAVGGEGAGEGGADPAAPPPEGGSATGRARPGPVARGPQIVPREPIKAQPLSAAERREFAEVWQQFQHDLPGWEIRRDDWLARGGSAPFVLAENLFHWFWRASLVNDRRQLARVAQNARVVGAPAVGYFAQCLVMDSWPLPRPITAEIIDPEDLDKRIRKTFHHFEMDDTTRRYAAQILATIGPPAVPMLRSDEVLHGARPTARRYAAYALGVIATPEALDALAGLLTGGRDWQDRAAAATALGAALDKAPERRAALEAALPAERDEFVQRKIREALAGEAEIRF